jgi:hypothetical protein
MNKINPTMKGRVEIILDCLGALNRVLYLPRTESLRDVDTPISSRTSSCTARDLSFAMYYTHIKAHQDDHTSFRNLDRKACSKIPNSNGWSRSTGT